MIKRKTVLAPAVLGAVLFGTASAQGVIIIDDFTDADAGQYPLIVDTLSTETADEFGLTGVLGGVRHTSVTATFLDIEGFDEVAVSVNMAGGVLDYASTAGADGELSLLYDGGSNLDADLSVEDAIAIDFLHFDAAASDPLPITVTLFDGFNTASLTMSLMAPGPQSLVFDFNSFTGIDMLDLTSIDTIEFDFDGALAADFRIGQITAIPGAGTLALLGLAGGLVGRRRRRA